MFGKLLRHWKMLDAQDALKAETYGNNMGPFLIAPKPPGDLGKDWFTDAQDVWVKGEYVVLYYGPQTESVMAGHDPRPCDGAV